jgi:hypothetical protein
MTIRILSIAAALAFLLGAFVSCTRDRSAGGPNATASPEPTLDAKTTADLKNLLFADQTLEELLNMSEPLESPPPNDPYVLFASSAKASSNNNADEAQDHLKQILALPDPETRIQLWAWKALRKLGQQPPPEVADRVQGVVCELHNEAGVGTLAAYADGRARWFGGQGNVILYEQPGGDAEISGLIRKILKAAEPLAKAAPLSDKHQTSEPEMEHFRVTILTFKGLHVVDMYGPSIDESQPIADVLDATGQLVDALARKSRETENKQKPSPR